MNAFQRTQEIPELIEDYCTNDTDDIMLTCRYRVIVCTCSMAGILYCAGLQSGHFTHVFVDEVCDLFRIPIEELNLSEGRIEIVMGQPQQCALVSDWPISIHNWVYMFPSVKFSIYVQTFYTLKSVRRKA